MTTKEKGFLDKLFDTADAAMDGIESGLSTVPDDDDEVTPLEIPEESHSKRQKMRTIDADSMELVATPKRVLMWGLVAYSGHPPAWHLFDGLTNVAMCGDVFESVSRRKKLGVTDAMSDSRTRVNACWNCINREGQ